MFKEGGLGAPKRRTSIDRQVLSEDGFSIEQPELALEQIIRSAFAYVPRLAQIGTVKQYMDYLRDRAIHQVSVLDPGQENLDIISTDHVIGDDDDIAAFEQYLINKAYESTE
jgi:hypothetical protein